MNKKEYEQVKSLTYNEYCDYLQQKYGKGLGYYFSKSWNKNQKVTRTKEGLYVHHKFEILAERLSNKEQAQNWPYEFQAPEALIYCDFLEHLLLHTLICEDSLFDSPIIDPLGLKGIIVFMIPELNDVYSGWITTQEWRKRTHDKIINDKDVYLDLVKRIKNYLVKKWEDFDVEILLTSLNSDYGLWENKNNQKLYDEIKRL